MAQKISGILVGQIFRFGIVGVTATAIQYGIYYILQDQININIAFTIGYIVSFIVNFLLTTYFTFRNKPNVKRGIGFAISHFVNYILQMICLNVVLSFGVSPALAPIPVFMICVPVNFLLVRFFITK